MNNFDFACFLMEKLEFDDNCTRLFKQMMEDTKKSDELSALLDKISVILSDYSADDESFNAVLKLCNEFALKSNYHEYSVYLFVCLVNAKILKDKFDNANLPEEIFFETVADFKVKLNECLAMHNIIGSFVCKWLFKFFKFERFHLGRMQFETREWQRDDVVLKNTTLKKGDEFIACHIPSNNNKFDKAARLDSYEKAIAFYKKYFNKDVKFIVCTSWLLDPLNKIYLNPSSNIADFSNDFEVILSKNMDSFIDAWRVFGNVDISNPSSLPEKTSLQRAFKQRLIDKTPFIDGIGIRPV